MNGLVLGSPRRTARIAGLFYLLTIVSGIFAEVFVRGAVVVRGDAAATAANIAAHGTLFRFGLVADLVTLASYIVVTVLFMQLFVPVDRTASFVAAAFSMSGIAVLAADTITHLLPILVVGSSNAPGAITAAQLSEVSLVALRLHGQLYVIADVFFGIYCLLLGKLIWNSKFLPRFVGALMAAGGIAYLFDSLVALVAPSIAITMPDLTALGGLAELILSLWLLIKALDEKRFAEVAQGSRE